MKKKFTLSLLLIPLLTVTSCGIKAYVHYENADSYSIGDATLDDEINSFNIDWISGDIEFKTHEENSIKIEDKTKGTLSDDSKLRYLLEDGTLYIKYCKSRTSTITLRSEKSLIVTIRNNAKYDDFFIQSISANVKGFLFAETITINGVSGETNFVTNCNTLKVNSISGNNNITFSNNPSEIKIDGTSSNSILHLPNCSGFNVSFDSTSGKININDFEDVSTKGNTSTYGDESTKISVNTVSGNLNILK